MNSLGRSRKLLKQVSCKGQLSGNLISFPRVPVKSSSELLPKLGTAHNLNQKTKQNLRLLSRLFPLPRGLPALAGAEKARTLAQ